MYVKAGSRFRIRNRGVGPAVGEVDGVMYAIGAGHLTRAGMRDRMLAEIAVAVMSDPAAAALYEAQRALGAMLEAEEGK